MWDTLSDSDGFEALFIDEWMSARSKSFHDFQALLGVYCVSVSARSTFVTLISLDVLETLLVTGESSLELLSSSLNRVGIERIPIAKDTDVASDEDNDGSLHFTFTRVFVFEICTCICVRFNTVLLVFKHRQQRVIDVDKRCHNRNQQRAEGC